MTDKLFDIDQKLIKEWRELGFYYDLDSSSPVNQWKFFGSKNGLQNFVELLNKYTADPRNNVLSEHEHYGPYCYLKVMTWDKAVITTDCLAGTIEDLKILKDLIAEKVNQTKPGQVFRIDNEYGVENPASAIFFVMAEDFDPVLLDDSLVSKIKMK